MTNAVRAHTRVRVTEPTTDLPADAPRKSIGIGITGHRLQRLDASAIPAITAAADSVLDSISSILALPDPASLRLITALADGADSLLADAAIARGWTMDAVLPFARDDYAQDFTEGDARNDYVRRVDAARSVFELPGSRTDSAVAYERAGRVVLAQCDVLIAVWDGGEGRGRGGAAQIVAEAVAAGIPVIHIHAHGRHPPELLWDGLTEHRLGQQTVETIARGTMDHLPRLLTELVDLPASPEERRMLANFGMGIRSRWRLLSLAYPLLLAVMGVRGLRRSDLRSADPPPSDQVLTQLIGPAGKPPGAFGERLSDILAQRFARSDATASTVAQVFRSGWVVNFALGALAVLLSLAGLVIPDALKPVLVVLEVLVIAVILAVTRAGNRAGWHRRWLDNRHLAERLRCLAISAQLGDLDLRGDAGKYPGWVAWYVRSTARELGMPDARVDENYLTRVRNSLTALIDDQIAYLGNEARRMHHLDHRLHKLGTLLFTITAAVCVAVFVYKVADKAHAVDTWHGFVDPLLTWSTIIGAGLPAIGAAIYAIRVQGDFSGTAQRNHALAHTLQKLRTLIDTDNGFDALVRRARWAGDLLTEDLANWLQTYHARPLTLPG
ncbi:MAG: hypothetical protein V4530_03790 [Pseudomonadota bacterium]